MSTVNIYSNVKFPQMRQILIFAIQSLSDRETQMREWISSTAVHRFWDTMKFDIDVIYHDLDLDSIPEDQLGYSLMDQEEINIIKPLTDALDAVCDRIGFRQPDSAYIISPLWDDVVHAAKAAFDIFMANEEKAKQTNPYPWNGEDDWPATIASRQSKQE